jgi:hypothetical protein
MLVLNRYVKVTLWSFGDWTDLVEVSVISYISQPNSALAVSISSR